MKIDFHAWPLRPTGGQQVSDKRVGVLAVDIETGLAVVVDSERSQHANKQIAERRLVQLVAIQAPAAIADSAVVKLSELVATRSRMKRGSHGDLALIISKAALGISTDSVGLLATHNAADVLIEIALRAHAWHASLSSDTDYRVQDAACNALATAIAKVTP